MLLFVSPTLLRFMHVQWAEKYQPKAIFVYMGKIISYIGGLGNIIRKSQTTNEYNGDLFYDLNSPTSLDSSSL